ncbi:hypothetical protein EJ03DRAFT_328628 [Teratosphaeria nubilosa]|uniref:MARVEL domain-containing protein n=1 Tax=Teratosphaeria nubilosa TaxID=161662 RepID=A0A6G1L6L3_9PEZI|nr:hypothetical protein EJ03DRAFT_328628 [Teratosphaeria nubilosa]
MGLIKGGFLRLFQTFLYALAFCCSGIILGIYSYFLSVLADRNAFISKSEKAVEGLSGAATLYLIFAVLLTCCLGGISFLAFVAVVLDVCFIGCMIAIAILTRHGASSCKGFVRTPLGSGEANQSTGGFGNGDVVYSVHLRTACRLNTAAFAVSIIGAFLFLCTALMQVALVRSHKKEKRYGPSPDNNYTSGLGKKRGFFGKKNKNANKDTELGMTGTAVGAGAGAGGLAAGHPDTRPSHDTAYTGSTMAGNNGLVNDKVDTTGAVPHATHGGYYTQPQGTGVNPYGYDNTVPQPTYTTGTATNY